ncbi:MAG: hypothetical protein KDM64_19305, partial [Verrucomicrobiae bacterium]|nr:hypothetical protein [Verrucomicrobiae bacterium]
MKSIDDLNDEAALFEEHSVMYGLAGMVTFVESAGGQVIQAVIDDRRPRIKIENSPPFLGFDAQMMGAVHPATVLESHLKGLEPFAILQMAVAQLGAEISFWWAAKLAPVSVDLSSYLPPSTNPEGDDATWHDRLSATFAESLGLDPEGALWWEMIELIYQHSRQSILKSWYAVEYYRTQLERKGRIGYHFHWD